MTSAPRASALTLAACLALAAATGSCSPHTRARAGSIERDTDLVVNFSRGNAVIPPSSANPHGQPVIRFDTQGNAVDAHDGELKYFDGTYHLYGTSYACGFRWASGGKSVFCGFKSYSSGDLVHWTDEGLLFDPTPWQHRRGFNCADHGCFRPHVLRNSAGKYILWVNTATGDVGYRVFSSDTPTGPFILEPLPSKLLRRVGGGDHDLFKDDDGTGYLIDTNYSRTPQPTADGTSREFFRLVVEKLNVDFTDGTGQYARLPPKVRGEAPTMFKRQGRYYIVYDAGCAYCPHGRASYVTASDPLGPWLPRGELSEDSCGGQVTHVERIDGAYLFMGDLWYQNTPYIFDPLTMYGNQGRASYFWGALSFGPDGGIKPLACVASLRPTLLPASRGAQEPLPDLDQSAGVAGFSSACDIGTSGGKVQRLQTFRPSRSGILTSLAITTFQSGTSGGIAGVNVVPDADLGVEIIETRASDRAAASVASFLIPRASISFSPRKVTVSPRVFVRAGREYGIVLRAAISEASRGCYGFAYSDANPYPNGVEKVSADGGRSFSIEPQRALKFETAVIVLPSTALPGALGRP